MTKRRAFYHFISGFRSEILLRINASSHICNELFSIFCKDESTDVVVVMVLVVVSRLCGKAVAFGTFNKPLRFISVIFCAFTIFGKVFISVLVKPGCRAYKKRKTDYKTQRFNFHPSFSPEAFYLIKSESVGEKTEVAVDITEEVAKRLMEYAAIAKATEAEE